MIFADESVRRIIEVKDANGSLIVFLNGTPFDGNKVGYPKEIKASDTANQQTCMLSKEGVEEAQRIQVDPQVIKRGAAC